MEDKISTFRQLFNTALVWVMKNKPCKCINPKIFSYNIIVVKKCNAEDRPNADYEILQ